MEYFHIILSIGLNLFVLQIIMEFCLLQFDTILSIYSCLVYVAMGTEWLRLWTSNHKPHTTD